MRETADEIVEKTPLEERWKMAGKAYTGSIAGYDIFVGQAMGKEKWQELHDNLWGEGGKMTLPAVQKAFNIPVDDAIGASTLVGVAIAIQHGPEWEYEEPPEWTPKRAVYRVTKCPWYNRYTEFGIKPEDMVCPGGHIRFSGDGIKAVNPKITHKLLKAMPWGDDYCEGVYELEE
jgi:hypothetical protein